LGYILVDFFLKLIWSPWDRSYDHNFRWYLVIFGEKLPFFSQKPMLWSKFWIHNFALFWVKNANFVRRIFRRKYLKYPYICPWSHRCRFTGWSGKLQQVSAARRRDHLLMKVVFENRKVFIFRRWRRLTVVQVFFY
jgi:hypothetical protein